MFTSYSTRPTASVFVIVVFLIFSGCNIVDSGSSESIDFETDKASYEIGQTIRAKITNNTSGGISFGACAESVDGVVDGEWVSVHIPEVCIEVIYFLDPGESFEHGLVIEEYAPADRYRIMFLVSANSKTEIIESNSFTISG